jgi:hypothetical protein
MWKGIVGRGFSAAEFHEYVSELVWQAWRPQFVVVHNMAEPKFAEWHNVSGTMRMANLERYYRDVQHWSAGPHLFVADDLIWVFTPLTTPGVHSPSWNAISWGMELVGDYATESFTPVRDNAIAALAALHSVAGLDPTTMRFHKEDPRTTHKGCPGKNVVKPALIAAVEAALAVLHPSGHAQGAAGSG